MHPSSAIYLVALILSEAFVGVASSGENAQKPAELTKEGIAFFETHIRPVLAERCYECHSTKARKVKGKLLLDSQPGIAKGGRSGPAIVPGDVEKSRLIQAIRWTDADFAMPPKGKLSLQQIARFEQWVKMGAPIRARRRRRDQRRRRRGPTWKPAARGGRLARSDKFPRQR